MAHGNRTYEAPKVIHQEWQGVSKNKQNISQWIRDCVEAEKEVSMKNKIAREAFHSELVSLR